MESSVKFHSEEQIKQKIEILRKGFRSQKTLDINFRKQQLKLLLNEVKRTYDQHLSSKKVDLGWSNWISHYASYTSVSDDLNYILNNFESWTKKRKVETPIAFFPASSYLLPEPYGVSLIFSAWNSQFLTLVMPIAAAIAAGNVCLAKPSEMSPATAIIVEQILGVLDPDICQVVQGDFRACEFLLKNQFDLIIFTGSPEKGKSVAKAAAEFLTPCILELGGQNPTIVDETCDLENAIINIANGRYLNAGQICIAPEYVLVHESVLKNFTEGMKRTVQNFFQGKANESSDYAKIVNVNHTKRIGHLAENHGGKLIVGGSFNAEERYVEPTIVEYESIEKLRDSKLFQGEIFGPILYYTSYKNLDEAINFINSNHKPLAMYYFGTSSANKKRIETETSAGAIVMNDTIVHFASSYLPFGGVGNSGIGSYHGRYGFENMSHIKPVMDRKPQIMPLRYPPFTSGNISKMKFLLNLTFTQEKAFRVLLYVGLALIVYLFRVSIFGTIHNLTASYSSKN
jgi:aldehyde dehydrogenase (NAD+)